MTDLAFRWVVVAAGASLKVLVLSLLVAAGIWIFRVRNSAVRHAAWFSLLVAMWMLPLLTAVLPSLLLPLPAPLGALLPNRVEKPFASVEPTQTLHPEPEASAEPSQPRVGIDQPVVGRRETPSFQRESEFDSRPSDVARTRPTSAGLVQRSTRELAPAVTLTVADRQSGVAPVGPNVLRSSWALILASSWLAIALALCCRQILALYVTWRLVRRSTPVSVHCREGQAARRGRANLRVAESSDIRVPLTTGPVRPVVLLPSDWRMWSAEKLSNVLNHEATHVARRDCLTCFLSELTTCLYCFHPLAWWLRRNLAALAEEACDDAVIRATEDRTAYARHLLEFAAVSSTGGGRIAYAGLSMARQSNVESRINAILDFGRPLSRRLTWAATLLIAAVVVPVVAVAAALRPSNDSGNGAAPSSTLAAQTPADRGRPLAQSNPNSPAAMPSAEPPEQMLTVTGRVLLPDGSPAANAIVSALGNQFEHGLAVRADVAGRFRLSHKFGWYQRIHARTADWRQQAWSPIAPDAVRIMSEKSLELTLAATQEHRVLVTSGGKPAQGVYLAAYGSAKAQTGPDGMASLWLPATTGFVIDAWHPRLGAARVILKDAGNAPTKMTKLALLAPKPQTIRVVDQNGAPVAGLRSSLTIEIGRRNWVTTADIDEAVIETDARGEVVVPWLPAEFTEVGVCGVIGPWKPDGAANRKAKNKRDGEIAIAHVQSLRPVTGRLILPSGAAPEGILISGRGASGDPNGVTFPFARARNDGTFAFLAAPGYAYCLAVSDTQWVSDSWIDVPLKTDAAQQIPITLNAYKPIPLTVRVTRGPKAEPWPGVAVRGWKLEDVQWTDARGRRRESGAILREQSPTTGADGTATFGISLGRYDLSFYSGDWSDERKITAMSDAPITITVHRPWRGNRQIVGQLMLGRTPRASTPTTTLHVEPQCESKLLPDGRFTVSTGFKDIYVLAADRKDHLAAVRHIGPNDPTADVDLTFHAPARYSGQVVDANGRPLAGYRVRLVADMRNMYADYRWEKLRDQILEETTSDQEGRYKFDQAPAGVGLFVCAVAPSGDSSPPWSSINHTLLLKSGESYDNDRLQREDSSARESSAYQPRRKSAANRLSDRIRDARLAQLPVLVSVAGDSTQAVQTTVRTLFDFEGFREVLHFLPVNVPAEEVEPELVTRLKLRPPKAKEILLAVVDGSGRTVDARYLAAQDAARALEQGAEFVKKHVPAPRDAHKLLADAQQQARQTGRRVWIIEGETRCAPCFTLARWLDDQHSILDREYVFVKLLAGIDEHVGDVLENLHQRKGGGIPWFAIIDPNGKILTTSETRDGNIGFPDDREGKAHLRQMLQQTARKLTPAEIDSLIQSVGE
jgi:beta-lactamase regulating signal transducer with metallopeptidase domain